MLFRSNAVIRDFSRDYLFRVDSVVFDGGAVITPTGLLYAKTAALPGRTIVDQTVKYAGQTFHVPGSVEYPGSDGYKLDFYCPENSDIREILMPFYILLNHPIRLLY